MHYSHALTISYPLETTAATLLWALKMEALQDGQPLPVYANSLPPNREVANATGSTGPTVQDIHDFHYRVRVQESYSEPFLSASEQIFDLRTSSEGSQRFDEHWSRLVTCHDLCMMDDMPLRGPVYQLGSLCGQWSGRFAASWDSGPNMRC